MPPPAGRSMVSPDSARATVAIPALDALIAPGDRAVVEAQVNVVSGAPGPALLLWGAEAVVIAYNRHYRSLASLRTNALGKPLFKAQPELERPWRAKLDLAGAGAGQTVD